MLKTLRDLGMGMSKRPKRCDTGKREDPGDEVAANCFFFFKMATAKRFAKLCLASDGEEGKLL